MSADHVSDASVCGAPNVQPPPMMLVSARVTESIRADASVGQRPLTEYLVLEREHGVHLFDWSELRRSPTTRGKRASVRHALAAWRLARSTSAVLSDGEHVGLPLAAAMRFKRDRPRHVVIAHHLTTAQKRRIVAIPGLIGGVDAFIVHSSHQAELLASEMGIPSEHIHLLHYGVDTEFWSPQGVPPERLVVSAGSEHRDFAGLVQAVSGSDASVFIADGSTHSPRARRKIPESWPNEIARGCLNPMDLRHLYGRASVVVVPVLETDFQAGITVIVEAMSMGKAVIATGTAGLRGAVADPGALVTVPPRDPVALRRAIDDLLNDPAARADLGRRARLAAQRHHDVHAFAASISDLL